MTEIDKSQTQIRVGCGEDVICSQNTAVYQVHLHIVGIV